MIQFLPSRAVAIQIGGFGIHWYGIMYALAFLIGIFLIPRLEHYRRLRLTEKQRTALYTALMLGVLIGGRLGYVLLYGWKYYLMHPLEIVAVWQGGMSSHGGIIGVALGLQWFSRMKQINVWKITDIIVVPVAIGLALGRVGNFINGELYGTITTVPWGMYFPGVDGLRHPTQLYAVAKDMLISIVCFLHLQKSANTSPMKCGVTTAIFLTMYGILRFIVEIFRDQPFGYVHLGIIDISWGQVYTIPVIIAGVVLYAWRSRVSCE